MINNDYISSVLNFNDYVSDKYSDVHNQLYISALNKYLEENLYNNQEYLDSHIFSEIKNKEYWQPSKVIIKSIEEPYTTKIVDLSQYWDNYEYKEENKELNSDYYQDKEDINAFVLVYIDYVNSKIKLKNKNSGKIIWKDIKYLNSDILIDENELTLKDTFTYKLQNKIYGK